MTSRLAAINRHPILMVYILPSALVAVGGGLVLDSLLAALLWIAAFGVANATLVVWNKHSVSNSKRTKILRAIMSVLAITSFSSMTLATAAAGGAPGQLFSFLMIASLLVALANMFYRAPRLIALSSIPAIIACCTLPFWPLREAPADPVQSAIGVCLGVLFFLLATFMRARANAQSFTILETANLEAKQCAARATQRRLEAEAADRTKTEFLMMVSHELRTPLNAVIGYSEDVAEQAEDLGEQEIDVNAQIVANDGRACLKLINQIINHTTDAEFRAVI